MTEGYATIPARSEYRSPPERSAPLQIGRSKNSGMAVASSFMSSDTVVSPPYSSNRYSEFLASEHDPSIRANETIRLLDPRTLPHAGIDYAEHNVIAQDVTRLVESPEVDSTIKAHLSQNFLNAIRASHLYPAVRQIHQFFEAARAFVTTSVGHPKIRASLGLALFDTSDLLAAERRALSQWLNPIGIALLHEPLPAATRTRILQRLLYSDLSGDMKSSTQQSLVLQHLWEYLQTDAPPSRRATAAQLAATRVRSGDLSIHPQYMYGIVDTLMYLSRERGVGSAQREEIVNECLTLHRENIVTLSDANVAALQALRFELARRASTWHGE